MHLRHRYTQGPLPTSRYDFIGDAGEMLGYTQIRHRASHAADLPPEAASNLYYEIEEAHRGRGFGKALMRLALAEARRIGLETVRVTVDDDNPTSRHIIESHGAVYVATFQRDGGVNTHLYEVDLRGPLKSMGS